MKLTITLSVALFVLFSSCAQVDTEVSPVSSKEPSLKVQEAHEQREHYQKKIAILEKLNKRQLDSVILHQKASSPEKSRLTESDNIGEYVIESGTTDVISMTPPPDLNTPITELHNHTWIAVRHITNLWRVEVDGALDLVFDTWIKKWTARSLMHKGSRLSGVTLDMINWVESYGGGAPSGMGYAAYHEVKGTLEYYGVANANVDAVKYFVIYQPE